MPADLRFTDVKRKLESHGWRLTRIRGSHHVFTRENRPTVPIPVHRGKVKHAYVRLVEKAIGEFERKDTGE